MENFYSAIRENINDYDVIHTHPLSYIKTMISERSSLYDGNRRSIIICDEKNLLSSTEKRSTTKEIKEENLGHDLNLTGSPLRDSCQIDYIEEDLSLATKWKYSWLEKEESFQGIPLTRARQILGEVSMVPGARIGSTVWTICKENDENVLLTFINLTDECNRSGKVLFDGYVSYREIDLNELQQKHFTFLAFHKNVVDTRIDYFFNLNTEQHVKLQLTRSVHKPIANIFAEYDKCSRIILHQRVCIDSDSEAEVFWRQIRILDMIKDVIVSYKKKKDSNLLIYDVGRNDLASVKADIQQCFTDIIANIIGDDDAGIGDIESVVRTAKYRESIELTDKLWDILRGCSSMEDLTAALEHTFTCAVTYNLVNVPTNQTRLAEWIRDLANHRMAMPLLHTTQPLELLLEIGIEKVAKDYEFIFNESKLCSTEQLRQTQSNKTVEGNNNGPDLRKSLKSLALGGAPIKEEHSVQRKTLMHSNSDMKEDMMSSHLTNSDFNQNEIELRLARLGQIHLILEHLLLIQSTFNREHVYVDFLEDLKKPPKLVHILAKEKFDERQIVVSNMKILNQIDGSLPNQLRVLMKSSNKFVNVENTFIYSVEPICPPKVFNCMDSIDAKAQHYYKHHLLNIGSRAR